MGLRLRAQDGLPEVGRESQVGLHRIVVLAVGAQAAPGADEAGSGPVHQRWTSSQAGKESATLPAAGQAQELSSADFRTRNDSGSRTSSKTHNTGGAGHDDI